MYFKALHLLSFQVSYFCQMPGQVVIEIRVWSFAHKNYRMFTDSWSCTPHIRSPLRKNVRITLPNSFAYKPSVLNPVAHHAHRTLVHVFLLDETMVKKNVSDKYRLATIKAAYRVKVC